MYRSTADFLKYFGGVHRRALRDVGALPPEADGWAPEGGEGENAWSINQLVGHMAGSRLYFASAYRGTGWVSPPAPDVSRRELWLPALQRSFDEFVGLIESTPDEWLDRKVETIDSGFGLSGWRLLAMMAEHDIHHRSQIDTYAGLNGWEVPQIFNRSAERIGGLQESQRRKYRSEDV
ncbi:MAG: DinB family protein [Dehalococcoidia bacterium]